VISLSERTLQRSQNDKAEGACDRRSARVQTPWNRLSGWNASACEVVGWQVCETENREQARGVMRDMCVGETFGPKQVVLHADNGWRVRPFRIVGTRDCFLSSS
jgi:hypothetical protein